MKCNYEGRQITLSLFIHVLANTLYIVTEEFEWGVDYNDNTYIAHKLTLCCAIDLVLTIPVLLSYLWPEPGLLAPLACSLLLTGPRNAYLMFSHGGLLMGLVYLVFPYQFSFLLLMDARELKSRGNRDASHASDSSEVNRAEETEKELRNMFEGLGQENECIEVPGNVV